jgi:hypothetical protein
MINDGMIREKHLSFNGIQERFFFLGKVSTMGMIHSEWRYLASEIQHSSTMVK